MSEITELLSYLNQSNGIPLVVTQTSTTNPFQFYITLILSGFFVIMFVFPFIASIVSSVYGFVLLKLFVRNSSVKHLVVVKHTSSDLFSQAMINQSTLNKLHDALIKFKGKAFDIILWTPGGEIFSATYISRMLSQYKGRIRSFIPIYSMSGGTLLALSTDEIYMNDYSSLGNVDPQLGNLFKFGSARSWKEIVKLKGKKADDSTIAFKHMGDQYTRSIRQNIEKLLLGKVSLRVAKNLAYSLTSGDVEHGYNLTKDLLRINGLPVRDIPDKTNIRIIKLLKRLPEGVTIV